MNLIKLTKDDAKIKLDMKELVVINNALNEICHGIEVFEFETRIADSLENVQALLNQFSSLINEMDKIELD